jgi:hypothetical protein
MVFENNELAYNNYLGFSSGWEAGATKWVKSDSLTIRNNWVHHNLHGGPGLWCDIDNNNILMEGNVCEYNGGNGIFQEIGFKATITCNISRFNGKDYNGWMYGAQIMISASSNVEVSYNIIETAPDFGDGITLVEQDRGEDHHTHSNYIHHNDITIRTDYSLDRGDYGFNGADADYNKRNFWYTNTNRFDYNTYHLRDTNEYHFKWATPETETDWPWDDSAHADWGKHWGPWLRFAGFRERGQEANGTADANLDASPSFTKCSGYAGISRRPYAAAQTSCSILMRLESSSKMLFAQLAGRAGEVTVRVVDASGRTVARSSADTHVAIDMSALRAGVYFARARARQASGVSQRIVLLR